MDKFLTDQMIQNAASEADAIYGDDKIHPTEFFEYLVDAKIIPADTTNEEYSSLLKAVCRIR